MKASVRNLYSRYEDEFTGFYNWSERTAIYFRTKKQRIQLPVMDSMIDLLCMTATAIAMIDCL